MEEKAMQLTILDSIENGISKKELLDYMKTKEFEASFQHYLTLLKKEF